jgi:hypothetical protein
MKTHVFLHRTGSVIVLACCLCAISARAQTITQSFVLQPGWNSVYLEVQPADNSAATVFTNLPISSVWTRAGRVSSAEFIQDASEDLFNQPGWLVWFNPARPDAFLGNLFAVLANHAYLIHVTNSTTVTWNVSGRPSLRRLDWVPDAYNLRGLAVDPSSSPMFLNFFRPSAAHFDPVSGQLQKIFRLSPAGQWTLTAPTDAIKSGEAYWIFCKGASDYAAPLDAQVDLGDGLDFGLTLSELNLRVRNFTGNSLNAMIQEMSPSGPGALAYYRFDPAAGVQWLDLPTPLVVSPGPNAEVRLRLAVRRQNVNGANYTSLLQITDGAGTRLLVPVNANKEGAGAGALALQGGRRKASASDEAKAHAGLWSGSVTINAVSEPRSANPNTTTPVHSPLNLRLIIHVDDTGQARLLKELIQMWRNGTYTNDASGNQVVDKPGEYVLLTDDTLIPQFSGATVRDGTPAGRRLSTVGFDFPSASDANYLNLAGFFAVTNSLTASITLPYDAPTNPFLHRYNPDHDNLNPRFDGPAAEAYTVTRQIELDFTTSPPDGSSAPDFGYNEMGGIYHETITGLHKDAIHVSGTFRLSRASLISQLNPSPTP